jgi:hypothetical protein
MRPDHGRRPYQSFDLAFKVRNLAGHAKTATITFDTPLSKDRQGLPIRPASELERLCEVEVAERVFADVGAIIAEIHEAAGKGEWALWLTSHTEWSGPADEV